MKRALPPILVFLLFVSHFLPSVLAQSVDAYFYDPNLNGLSDVTIPGISVSLHMSVYATAAIRSGQVTISLPPEFTYNGNWQWRNGSILNVTGNGSTITVDLDSEEAPGAPISLVEAWFTLSVASVDDLPPTAEKQNIGISANLETSKGTETIEHNFETCILFSRGRTRTSTDGSGVRAEDEFTVFVDVDPFPHFDLYYSRIGVNMPNDTDLVPGSVSGLDGYTQPFSNQIAAEFPNGRRSFSFSFRVKVRDQFNLDIGEVTEIVPRVPSVQFRVKTPFTGNRNHSSGTFHYRYFGTAFEPIEPIEVIKPNTEVIVNSTGDAPRDPNSEDGCSTGDTIANGDPECTLRSALEAVNAGVGKTITFDIPGGGIPTIPVLTALPVVTEQVVIDATTQAAGLVEVRGNGLEASGLDLQGGSSTVKGLVINGFIGASNAAIKLSTYGGNKVLGNFIGTDPTGGTHVTTTHGVIIDKGASGNQIGGTGEGEGNVIAAETGVSILHREGSPTPDGNQVTNNRIGLSPGGSFIDCGVGVIVNSGIGNRVAGNRVAGSTAGIVAEALAPISTLTIEDNQVGLDASGSARSGLKGAGILLISTDAALTSPIARNNKVAGNQLDIWIVGATTPQITGNRLGLKFDGSVEVPGGDNASAFEYGVRLDRVDRAEITENVIAGHVWDVVVSGTPQYFSNFSFSTPASFDEPGPADERAGHSLIRGNSIGIENGGKPSGGAARAGIAVFSGADGIRIEDNTVAGHGRAEVWLVDGDGHTLTGNHLGTDNGTDHQSQIGVLVEHANGATIGSVGLGNVIGNNALYGILIDGSATGTRIEGNRIGVSGTSEIWPNRGGIFVKVDQDDADDAPVPTRISRNEIGGSEGGIICFTSAPVIIEYNFIGVRISGISAPNEKGIAIDRTKATLIGNTIANNSDEGILVEADTTQYPVLIDGGSIHDNGEDPGDGIHYLAEPFAPPTKIAGLRSNSNTGEITLLFAAPAAGVAGDVTYQFYGNRMGNNPQGEVLMFTKTVRGDEALTHSMTAYPGDVFAILTNFRATMTIDGRTSEFSTELIQSEYEEPELRIAAVSEEGVVISWIGTPYFKLKRNNGLVRSWTDVEAEPVIENGEYTVVVPFSEEGGEFFRLDLDADALFSE